jgi:hypothetical protein
MNPKTDSVLPAQLTRLAKALRSLHKLLIERETQHFGSVANPLEHLALVTNHPQFAWLQKLSGLMVELDEQLDDVESITVAMASAYRNAIERLIGPQAASDAPFRSRYVEFLHESPNVAIAHGEVRKALAELPASPDTPPPIF